MSTQLPLELPSSSPSNSVFINARCMLQTEEDLAVNLVVSCSNRKRYGTAPGLAAHELVGSDVRVRLQTWKKRLKTVKAEKYPAEDLYKGEHWSVVRDIQSNAMSRGWNVRLWICSAGYGLIRPSTRIHSYQVTFAPSTIRVARPRARDRL